jgi:hypothetical protein
MIFKLTLPLLAETFAEVIGVVSQSHFKLVHKMFTEQLDLLRKETPFTPLVIGKIISLLMGMKFFRIKVTLFIIFKLIMPFRPTKSAISSRV